ncbi:MAG TPA: cyclic pyranopterin monophosphate synthase MoaC [Actinomycetota bacterium]|nr:cyclic pyranopterin monophosphate synthase MoaC [Actinomycetota bacterium]
MSDVHPEARARMVDVTDKAVTERIAVAEATVVMSTSTRRRVTERDLEKGDALEVARVAGIMGAKRAADLIPLCHPIPIDAVELDLVPVDEGISISATVKTAGRTGVEMEALTAVTVAALTLYDMIKATERGAEIVNVRLLRKSGGKSGDWRR